MEVLLEGSDIPEQQRLRRFRVDLPAVDSGVEPSARTYESRDVCLYSPNVRLRCAPPNGDIGQGVSYNDTGGIRRCEQSFTQPSFPGYDIVKPLSGEYNHRVITDLYGQSVPTETPTVPGEAHERWKRQPHTHERVEHNTSFGLAQSQALPG